MKPVLIFCFSLLFQNIYSQDDYLKENIDYEKVLLYYDSLLAIDSTGCLERFNRSLALRKAGRHEEAIRDITFVIEECKDISSATFYSRAKSYQKLQQYNLAIKDYIKAISLTPSTQNVWDECFQIGFCYAQQERYIEAAEWYTKAIQKAPAEGICYYNRGLAYYNLKDTKLACDNLRKASSLGIHDAATIIKQICQ
jgi:tetratricopeptide (TPR) repeat protein